MPVSLSLVRDSFRHLCDSFHPIKSFISSKFTFSLWVLFVRTLYIMYHQTCRLCVICTNTSYVTLDFHAIHSWCLDFSSSVNFFYFFKRWFSLLQLAIMRFLFLRNFRPFNGVLLIEVCVSASSFVCPCCHALRKHNVFTVLACHSRLLVYYSRTMNVVKQPYVTPNLHPHGKHYAPERAHVVGHLCRFVTLNEVRRRRTHSDEDTNSSRKEAR